MPTFDTPGPIVATLNVIGGDVGVQIHGSIVAP